ncbi:MAG: hypothetical protein GY906_40190 [bacterium]|nr:hypothetical protein [bacterium]
MAGLEVAGTTAFGGRVTIDRNAIIDNFSVNGVGGLLAATDNGLLSVVNNLIAGNSSGSARGAGLLSCSGETTWVTNNTVADNTCPGCTGGLEVTGAVGANLSNNILWGNDTLDLMFSNSSTRLMHNDIGTYSGNPHPDSTGNLSTDPLFLGGDSYKLQILSPLRDQGTNNPAGGLPETDLDGYSRVQAGQVDIGAYEGFIVFYSSFEDPTLSDWSFVFTGK